MRMPLNRSLAKVSIPNHGGTEARRFFWFFLSVSAFQWFKESCVGKPLHFCKRSNKYFLLAASVFIFLAGCQSQPQITQRKLNGETLHEAWRVDAGAPVNHPPLRIGDVLIVAPIDKPLLGLDVETGKTLWSYDPGARIWERAYASDGEFLFIGIEDGGYVALDPSNGKEIWRVTLGINSQMPSFVSGDVIYVPTTFAGPGMIGDPNGRAVLFALSAKDGKTLWSFETDNYILQTPFAQGDTVYAAGSFSDPRDIDEGGHMRLYALDAGDGSMKWEYESEDGFTKQVYATADYVTYIAYQDFLVGADAKTGEALWRTDTGNWVPTLMGSDDVVYYGSANTKVHAVDIKTGNTIWTYNIPQGTFNYLLGAPVLVEDELVFLTQVGEIVALDAATGEFRWQAVTDAAASRTGISISGGWIFLGDGSGGVYAFTDE